MASGTRSQRKPLTPPMVYYSINLKFNRMSTTDDSDTGQLLLLLEDGPMSIDELTDSLQGSLDFMLAQGKGGAPPPEWLDGYEQHKSMKATLVTLLEKLCRDNVLVKRDTRKRRPCL